MRSGHFMTIDRSIYRISYLFLGLFLLGLVSVPAARADRWRSKVASLSSFFWCSTSPQTAGLALPSVSEDLISQAVAPVQQEPLKETLFELKDLQQEADRMLALLGKRKVESVSIIKRIDQYRELLAMRYQALPAQVIFRDPAFWSCSIWIALGDVENRLAGRVVIGKNSPVLSHGALIGVVEYVDETQARVRLISDAGLAIAVRAARGGSQNREIFRHVHALANRAKMRPDLFASPEEQSRFLSVLGAFQERLSDSWEDEMLAKGELRGSSAPLWRSQGAMLKGNGFNYDYPDEEGPARDLRTGAPLGTVASAGSILIRQGDLLVTSGLDGVFPSGIPVAIVSSVGVLREGSYSYELMAKPAAGSLHDLQTVWVLPPLDAGRL